MPLSRSDHHAPEHYADAIDQGGALMVTEILLKAMAALPQGRDLLLQAMNDKTREIGEMISLDCADAGAPAALALMRQVVEEACAA
jgi:hypothetical protein